ncbi:hypothetical protein Bbelb_261830 [Branchiostoma belcheri]|nr:hypothetical protein Bbelb_261830 [Branchiostoma belcheri]
MQQQPLAIDHTPLLISTKVSTRNRLDRAAFQKDLVAWNSLTLRRFRRIECLLTVGHSKGADSLVQAWPAEPYICLKLSGAMDDPDTPTTDGPLRVHSCGGEPTGLWRGADLTRK